MKTPIRVPFFGRFGFLRSPPVPFHLLVYAESLSLEFMALDPRPSSRAQSVYRRVLEFVDDCAIESDSDTKSSIVSGNSLF